MYINMALELLLFIFECILCSFLVVLPFLYDLNAKFRYYFKFFVLYFLNVWINLILITLNGCSILGIPCTSIPPKLYKFVSRVLDIKWEVEGEEHLNLDKSYVIIANEQNLIDILGISTILPQLNGNVVTNQKKLSRSPSKYTSRLRDMLFTNKIEDYATLIFSLEIVKEMMRKKVNIWFFFEQIHDFKTNAFRLAIKEKIPIVPMIFSRYYFIDTHRKIFEPGNVRIQVLEPCQTGQYSVDDVSVLVQKIETTMSRAFEDLSDRVTPPSIEELRRYYGFT